MIVQIRRRVFAIIADPGCPGGSRDRRPRVDIAARKAVRVSGNRRANPRAAAQRLWTWWTLANLSRAIDLFLKLGAIPLSLAAFNVFAIHATLSWSSYCDITIDQAAVQNTYSAIGTPEPEAVNAYVQTWNANSHMPMGQGFPYAMAEEYGSNLCKVGPVLYDGYVTQDPAKIAAIHSVLKTGTDDRLVPLWEPGLDNLALSTDQFRVALTSLYGAQLVRGRIEIRNSGNGDARNVNVVVPVSVQLSGPIAAIPAGAASVETFTFAITTGLLTAVNAQPTLSWQDQGPDVTLLAGLFALLVLFIWVPAVLRDIGRAPSIPTRGNLEIPKGSTAEGSGSGEAPAPDRRESIDGV
jgi:hypothetical protein